MEFNKIFSLSLTDIFLDFNLFKILYPNCHKKIVVISQLFALEIRKNPKNKRRPFSRFHFISIGTTYYHPTMSSSQSSAAVKKRKPSFGRRRRDVILSADNRNDTLASISEEDMLAEPAPEQIYQVLLSMSEGFVKYQNL